MFNLATTCGFSILILSIFTAVLSAMKRALAHLSKSRSEQTSARGVRYHRIVLYAKGSRSKTRFSSGTVSCSPTTSFRDRLLMTAGCKERMIGRSSGLVFADAHRLDQMRRFYAE